MGAGDQRRLLQPGRGRATAPDRRLSASAGPGEPSSGPALVTRPVDPEPVAAPAVAFVEDPVIQKAKEVAATFGSSLPNFFCQQVTTRYQSDHPKTGWDALHGQYVAARKGSGWELVTFNKLSSPDGMLEELDFDEIVDDAINYFELSADAMTVNFTPTGDWMGDRGIATVDGGTVAAPDGCAFAISTPGRGDSAAAS